MNDIIDILGTYGLNVPEDQQENFRRDVLKSYKSVAEFNKVVGERDTLQTANKNYETQVSTLNTQISTYQTQNSQLNDKVTKYERNDKVTKAGISSEFVGFVSHEVGKLVTDTKDFDTALKEYVEGHQHFKAGAKTKTSTSPKLDGEDGKVKSNSQKMTEAILIGAGKK